MKAEAQNVKHGRPIILRKRFVFKFDLKESTESFCRRGRGRSFHVEEPKTEMVREPTVESLVRGIWRLRVSD